VLCKECNKRDRCVKLCKAAERYVNQDYIPFSELYLDVDADYFPDSTVWNLVDLENSNRLKTAIRRLSKDGKSTREIAYYVPCVQSYVVKVLNESDHQF